jgi:hypothetical protein
MFMGENYIDVCVMLFKAELNLVSLAIHLTFYSSRSWQLHCDSGPDKWLQGG